MVMSIYRPRFSWSNLRNKSQRDWCGIRRFKTNIFKIVAFQVFAVTVFARVSDEAVLRSILAVLKSEISAEEQVGAEKYENWITTCRPSDFENSPGCTFKDCMHPISWNLKCKSCYWTCKDTKNIAAENYPRSIHAANSYYGRRY